MTLSPQDRVVLTDALRPPARCSVDVAVGTTYSLSLTALLMAPLSFALADHAAARDNTGAGPADQSVDPIRLLEAVRRHGEHTTVFCQAGAIHVPSDYRSILTFVEDSVVQATPPSSAGGPGGIFHPKVWALRFRHEAGDMLHRVVVLSRNLTLDRSWDTILVLDEDPAGSVPAAPAARLVRALPDLAVGSVRPLTEERRAQIFSLAGSLETVRLAPPAPFDGGVLLPLGTPGADGPGDTGIVDVLGAGPEGRAPFPDGVSRILAISPFLTPDMVAQLASVSQERILVSRPETLDGLGNRALAGWDVNVLQRQAEGVESEPAEVDEGGEDHRSTEFRIGDGLHAKTVVMDLPRGRSQTVTGSANLTSPAWTRNVEFDAVLAGPTRLCGVGSVLDSQEGEPGLRDVLEAYEPENEQPASSASVTTSLEIERFHRLLAQCLPRLEVDRTNDAVESDPTVSVAYTLALSFGDSAWTGALPADGRGWVTTVRPVSLGDFAKVLDPRSTAGSPLVWSVASLLSITPFLAVQTRAGTGEAAATEGCVIKADLVGDVDGRRESALRSILTSKEAVLRYLAFLLGDPTRGSMSDHLTEVADPGQQTWGARLRTPDITLFEPLVRAAGRDDDELGRVAGLVDELRATRGGQDLIPEDFEALWDVVWQAHRTLGEEVHEDA